jgi:hypothetical protein
LAESGGSNWEPHDTLEPITTWKAETGPVLETSFENSHIDVIVGCCRVSALIDTGATVSVVPVQLYNEWLRGEQQRYPQQGKHPGLLSSVHKSLMVPNGGSLHILGLWRAGVQIKDHIFMTDIQVVEGLEAGNLGKTPMVLGRDFLQTYGVHLDFENEKFIVTPHLDLYASETILIPGGQHQTITVQSLTPVYDGVTAVMEGAQGILGIGRNLELDVGEGAIRFQNRQAQTPVHNPHPHDVIIHAGEKVGKCQPVIGAGTEKKQNELWQMYIPSTYKCGDGQTCWTIQEDSQEERNLKENMQEREEVADTPKLDLTQSQLTPDQKLQVIELVNEYRDVFVGPDGKIGRTNYIQHHIRIEPGTKPIVSRPYKVNYKNREVIAEQVSDMLEKNIIQPSASPWSAPVVLVPKPDGSLRFCVDYRRLNNVTVLEQFPLPDMRQSLEIFGSKRATLFSTLDLKSAYWQVEMCPDSAEKTAFITPEGLWQFRVLPFGLCGAPMTFSRLMSEVLKGLLWHKCLVYLDDIIVWSKDFPEHLEIMREVFERLRKAGLKLAVNKCFIGRKEVKYLGHYVSADGVRVDPKKISAVKDYPIPATVTQVRAFLGLAGYYRRFCKGFSEIARPLHYLTKQDVPFEWKDEQQQAFDTLKKMLTSAPLLAYPRADLPYILYTDASREAVGYVLSQEQEGVERVICYGGKSLSPCESNYSITELEFLAVSYAVEDCDDYLRYAKFTIVTDHASLSGYIQKTEPKGKMARRRQALLEYNFTIRYRPGRVHNNADACSRRKYPEVGVGLDPQRPLLFSTGVDEEEELETTRVPKFDEFGEYCGTLGFTKQDNLNFGILQKQDPLLKPYYLYHEGNTQDCSEEVWRSRDEYVIQDGVLFHIWVQKGKGPSKERTVLQVVVPREHRANVLKQYHDSPMGGHKQVQNTYTSIREKYYWPGMFKEISNWVKSCEGCARADRSKQRRNTPLQRVRVAGPFQQIHVDILGPLTEAENGCKYVLTMVDQFTRWVELIPLTNQKAHVVAHTIFDEWFCRYGCPSIMVSDRGKNFLSILVKHISAICHVKRIKTSSFHPSANGINERRNKVIIDILRRLLVDQPHLWNRYIASVAYVVRTMTCSSTNMSPFELTFGRKPVMPIDLDMPVPDNTAKKVMEQIQILQRKAEYLQEIARETEQIMKERYKAQFDKGTKPESYLPGDKCWVYTPSTAQKLKAGRKLVSCWIGPYRVASVKGPVNVTLRRCSDNLPIQQHIHVNRLKPYTARTCRPDPPPLEVISDIEKGKALTPGEIEPMDLVDDEESGISTPSKTEVTIQPDQVNKGTNNQRIKLNDPEPVEPEYYEVEAVLDKKIREGKEPLYLIKWKNYPKSQSTWEPLSNLNAALQEYLLKQGTTLVSRESSSEKREEIISKLNSRDAEAQDTDEYFNKDDEQEQIGESIGQDQGVEPIAAIVEEINEDTNLETIMQEQVVETQEEQEEEEEEAYVPIAWRTRSRTKKGN